jgi:hypothetical protein
MSFEGHYTSRPGMSVDDLLNLRKEPGRCSAVPSYARSANLIELPVQPLALAGRELRAVDGIDPHLPRLVRSQRVHNALGLVELAHQRTGAAGVRVGSSSA